MISLVSTNAASTAPSDAQGKDAAKLKSAAQAFEAVFLRQMISSMRSASLGDGIFDNAATGQFQDMADSNTADAMASKGVLGVAKMLTQQLGKTVAAQADDPSTKVSGA